MNRVLVTGATSFLGYHVAKRLNEEGLRPRVLELPDSSLDRLSGLNVERCAGHLQDTAALGAACDSVDTLLHLAFKVSVEGGAGVLAEMRDVNLAGTDRLLDAAAAKGVSRVVVAGSALAAGVNREPFPLNENADWSVHALDLPYATIRREAEQRALARAQPGFAVVAVLPAFTLGPDDPVGAPANKLLETLIKGKLRFTLPVGFGCLDVRDFASGVVLAAKQGASGQRYLLSGHNVTTTQFLEEAAALAGVRPPRFQPPSFLLTAVVAGLEALSKVRGKPAPISREVLQILGRYAWYDTTLARTTLGWQPRPLRQTLQDTIEWLRSRTRTN
jgi:dihydroflavonol-4-reductase